MLRIIADNWTLVLSGVMLSSLTTTTFYLITAYTPTYGKSVLHFADIQSLLITLCIGVSNLFWLPVGGAISDRIGRRPMLIAIPLAAILTAYPLMSWLVSDPSRTPANGLAVVLGDLRHLQRRDDPVPDRDDAASGARTAGFSLAFSGATAIFGGMTPAVCTYSIHATGNPAMPGAWPTFPCTAGARRGLPDAPLYGSHPERRRRACLGQMNLSEGIAA